MKKIILAIFTILIYCSIQQINAQKKEEKDKIRNSYDLKKINDLEKKYTKKNQEEKKRAFALADIKGWKKIIHFPNGSFAELQRVSNEDRPIYYTTLNTDASYSTRTNHLNTGGVIRA